jgi:predicted glycoside hydrolase/deacetylase ChbG (UPF0249 family)
VLAEKSAEPSESSAAPAARSETRRIWLCADDYGISPAVNSAIRDLVNRGRINATSVMVTAPSFHRSEATALSLLKSKGHRVAIGLHLTLTAPFRPLSKGYRPLRDEAFLPTDKTLVHALARQLNPRALREEITNQVRMFVHTFSHPPEFVDGHQHVHLFPQVREAVLDVVKETAPKAWVRQCGRVGTLRERLDNRKALLLDILSKTFRERAAAHGVRTNPAFAGAYAFHDRANFAALFPRFLEKLPADSVVMCHPGIVDPELRRLDPLTTLREQEYAFFSGESFSAVLATHGVALA